MRQLNILTPEYDIGDEVAWLDASGAIIKGTVRNITTTHGKHPKVFYQVATVDVESMVVAETNLLFAELSHIKPMFTIGMQVKTIIDSISTIIGISIEIDNDTHSVLYTTDAGDMLDEDDIVTVLL